MKLSKALLAIIIFAFIIRIANISDIPPSLNWDEVSHGYNAYSILETGRDEWGEFMPAIFKAYGDYKLPVYIYATSISEYFFGLNSFAVRLPSVLAGTFSVLFTYLLARELTQSHKTGLMAAVLMAIEPWSFFLSRIALEANLALFLIISGFYFMLSGIRKKNYELIISALLLGLSVWTYNSARVFVPLMLLAALLILRDKAYKLAKVRPYLSLLTAAVILLFMAPMFLQLANSEGQARFGRVQIIDEGAIAEIENKRATYEGTPFYARLRYNKATFLTERVARNYLSHFSPDYLFISGGSNYQFNIPRRGLIYLASIFLILLGIIKLLITRNKTGLFILSWILLAPVASSLTREAPHALRNIVTLPMPMILSAIGFSYLLKFRKPSNYKLAVIFAFLIAFALSFESYVRDYAEDYKTNYSQSWQYGYKQMVSYINNNYAGYESIIITKKYGEPHEFLLFYGSALGANWASPASYQSDPNLNRFNQSNWWWVDGFDKFFFVNDWEIPGEGFEFITESEKVVDCSFAKCLLITGPENYPDNWGKLDEINFLDDSTAFTIYEN